MRKRARVRPTDVLLETAIADIALETPPHDDLVTLLTGIRLEADVRAIAGDVARLTSGDPRSAAIEAIRSETGRLLAVVDLHRLLTDVPGEVDLSDHVVAVCSAITRCGAPKASVRFDLQVPRRRVDATTARWTGLILAALLCGPATASPVPVDAPVAVTVGLGSCFVEIEVTDGGADPPDRIAVGGTLLDRIVGVTRAAVDPRSGFGLSLLRMPFPGLAVLECAGSA